MVEAMTQVGLQLLLQPYGHTSGDVVCSVVGVVYPAYASCKAIEYVRLHGDTDEATRWLTYWAIYGLFSVLEKHLKPLIEWIPYYSPIKLMFLLWLQLPRFSGAYRLTSKFLRPFLHQYYPKIDEIVQSVCHAFSRPEIVAVTDAIQEVFARLPVLEWFMRQPDGRPWRPPSSSSSSFSSVLPGGGGGL